MWPKTKFSVKFDLTQLIPSLAVSVISGIIGIMISLSYAALIFSGELADYIATGIGMVLISAVILRSVIAVTSSFPGMIADTDALPSTILALMAATIEQQMSQIPQITKEQILITLLVAITLTSILTGAFLLTLGRLKFGGLIRFVPYPVIGGFLAGTGWLLIQGAFQVMTDITLAPSNIHLFFQADVVVRWVFGLMVGSWLFLTSRSIGHPLIVPGILTLAIALFYGGAWLTDNTIAELQHSGWLLSQFPSGGLWHPLDLSKLNQVNWFIIIEQIGSLMTIMIVSAVSILLTVSSMEIVSQKDIEINRELQAAGIGNIISGLFGGIVGYQMLADSIFTYKMGARNRSIGILTAIICLVVLIWGASLFRFIPKPIFGGLLLYLGLDFLWEWVDQARFKISQADYLIVLLIGVIIAVVGFLQGVAIGLILAVVLFVINYSLTDVIKNELSGATCQSNVQRFPIQEDLLQNVGEKTYLLKLQGFIFFGTANHLLNQIRSRMANLKKLPLRFVILDFHYVSGLDSSAIFSFVKLKQIAEQNHLTIVFTTVSNQIAKRLLQGNCLDDENELALLFPSLDRGLEWCENQLLQELDAAVNVQPNLSDQLIQLFLKPEQVPNFIKYLIPLNYEAGDLVFHQGDPSDGLYFLESGQVTVLVELPGKKYKRMRTFQIGTILGEMGIYDLSPRSASILVDRPSSLHFLSIENLEKMEHEDPYLATAVHQFIARLLVKRFKQVQQGLLDLI